MRTRSVKQQALALSQYQQLHQHQHQQSTTGASALLEPVRSGAQRKRKLQVAAKATTASAPAAPVSSAAAAGQTKKSTSNHISPNAKKAKLADARSSAAQPAPGDIPIALQQRAMPPAAMTAAVAAAIETPMKKPTLAIDTQAAPMRDTEAMHSQAVSINDCVGQRMSIHDYISPNAKQAKLESERLAAQVETETTQTAIAATQAFELKRPAIRRTLSYGSEEVLSDSSVENFDTRAPVAATSPVEREEIEDSEHVLRRVCGSRASQRKLPIIGREREQALIASVLNGKNESESERARSLFIIGPPGTGKSSSVDQLVGEYERRNPANAVVRMNCSTYTNPIALYAEIDAQLRMLTPYKLPYFDPCFIDEFLQDAVHRRAKCETVLVLDEVDQLLRLPPVAQKRVQDVLRFLLRWSALPSAKFAFVGIMNGVDMHAQLAAFLPKELDVPHVLFPAYTYMELRAILDAHVHTAAAERSVAVDALVEPRALEMIARKVASRDGDVRRAIGLLQQCARFCLRRCSNNSEASAIAQDGDAHRKITLRDVLACSSATLASGPVRDVHQLPRLPKILLYMITVIAPSDGKPCDMTTVSNELARLRATPGFAWMPLFKRDDLQVHLASLECYALVKRPTAAAARAATRNFWKAKLTSAVTLDVVDKAIQDDPLLRTLTSAVTLDVVDKAIQDDPLLRTLTQRSKMDA